MQPERLFRALGDETRLRLLYLLADSQQTLCVCEMMDALELPQYQISRHLGILRNAGLVSNERRGTWMYYALESGNAGNDMLFDFLRSYLCMSETPLADDMERLKGRLSLREGDNCVVGIAEGVR